MVAAAETRAQSRSASTSAAAQRLTAGACSSPATCSAAAGTRCDVSVNGSIRSGGTPGPALSVPLWYCLHLPEPRGFRAKQCRQHFEDAPAFAPASLQTLYVPLAPAPAAAVREGHLGSGGVGGARQARLQLQRQQPPHRLPR